MDQNVEDVLLDTDEEDTIKGKYLFFQIGKDVFAIELNYIREIVVLQTITEVPEVPEFVRGVINLRGQIVPAVDVRLRLNLPFKDYEERTCIVIVNVNDSLVGLIVDNVLEVNTMQDSAITFTNTQERNELESHYVKGIGRIKDEIKIILNVDNMLTDPTPH